MFCCLCVSEGSVSPAQISTFSIYTGIKALYWVKHSILGLVTFTRAQLFWFLCVPFQCTMKNWRGQCIGKPVLVAQQGCLDLGSAGFHLKGTFFRTVSPGWFSEQGIKETCSSCSARLSWSSHERAISCVEPGETQLVWETTNSQYL